jgi:hypothetical protein
MATQCIALFEGAMGLLTAGGLLWESKDGEQESEGCMKTLTEGTT